MPDRFTVLHRGDSFVVFDYAYMEEVAEFTDGQEAYEECAALNEEEALTQEDQ